LNLLHWFFLTWNGHQQIVRMRAMNL
jgi:hypothetical protein